MGRLELQIANPKLFQDSGIEDIASYEDLNSIRFGNGYPSELKVIKKSNDIIIVTGNILSFISLFFVPG